MCSSDLDLKVAIVATGGLSHQVHGERAGFLNEAWDNEFLDLLEKAPEQLVNMRLAEYVDKAGMEGAEVIMWLIMRGALGEKVDEVYQWRNGVFSRSRDADKIRTVEELRAISPLAPVLAGFSK